VIGNAHFIVYCFSSIPTAEISTSDNDLITLIRGTSRTKYRDLVLQVGGWT
jgi:hypothetical protein